MVLILSNEALIKRLLLSSIIQYSSLQQVIGIPLDLKACDETIIMSTYVNVGDTLGYSLYKYHEDRHSRTFDEQGTTALTS